MVQGCILSSALSGIPVSEMAPAASQVKTLTLSEQESMRTACRLTREVMDEAGRAVRVGITTDEIDEIVHKASIDRDCYPSPLNYRNFPRSYCSSVNETICHGNEKCADG